MLATAAASLCCHAVYLHHLAVGGLANLSVVGRILHSAAEAISLCLLPFTLVNHLLLFALNRLNFLVAAHTSPRLWLPIDSSYRRVFGAYPYNGLLWESLSIAILAVSWLLLVSLMCDAARRLTKRTAGSE